ncbi:hypothetical protein CCR97_05930 [Rhodoplanes elegans]|uniref:Uncharacterized protein n=1 Tax=Rhodoplanes elegans TaxID=29408 RepID=A0A327KAT7_9BRAD|nr:hypothetical protein [Rhodoplanes elegans]RAI32408.1 hypothetical protein CH338_24215 [Rhodoplanes elegans]
MTAGAGRTGDVSQMGLVTGISIASWPGSSRPSTPFPVASPDVVDARDAPGHDGSVVVALTTRTR